MFYMKLTWQVLCRSSLLVMAVSLMACSSSSSDSSAGTGGSGGGSYGGVSLTGASGLPSTFTPDLGLLTPASGSLDIITFTQAVTANRTVIISVSLVPGGIVTVMSDSDSATGGTSSWAVKNMGDEPTVDQAGRTVNFSNLQMVNVSTGNLDTINGTLSYDIGPNLAP